MNGRIYDPLLGRFLSADVLVDGVSDLQGYNRYSYVKNNPLSLWDPDGNRGSPPPGVIAAHNKARANWRADGGWMQVPAGASAGVTRGVLNTSAGVGWILGKSASGYEQVALGMNGSGAWADAVVETANEWGEAASGAIADTLEVERSGEAFSGLEGTTSVGVELGIPLKLVPSGAVDDLIKGASKLLDNVSERVSGLLNRLDNVAPETLTEIGEISDVVIREGMAKSILGPTQRSVSKPIIERDVQKIRDGSIAPEIKVEDGKIVDGHHREIAGQIAGQPPGQVEGTLPTFKKAQTLSWDDVDIDEIDYDNPN